MQTNNSDLIKKSISLIVARYRDGKSLREFAGELSEKTPVPISHTRFHLTQMLHTTHLHQVSATTAQFQLVVTQSF